jgi:hypothetical protein
MSHGKSQLSKLSKNSHSTHANSAILETPPLERRRKMTEFFQSIILDRSELAFPHSKSVPQEPNPGISTDPFKMHEEPSPESKTSIFNMNFDEFHYK